MYKLFDSYTLSFVYGKINPKTVLVYSTCIKLHAVSLCIVILDFMNWKREYEEETDSYYVRVQESKGGTTCQQLHIPATDLVSIKVKGHLKDTANKKVLKLGVHAHLKCQFVPMKTLNKYQ